MIHQAQRNLVASSREKSWQNKNQPTCHYVFVWSNLDAICPFYECFDDYNLMIS